MSKQRKNSQTSEESSPVIGGTSRPSMGNLDLESFKTIISEAKANGSFIDGGKAATIESAFELFGRTVNEMPEIDADKALEFPVANDNLNDIEEAPAPLLVKFLDWIQTKFSWFNNWISNFAIQSGLDEVTAGPVYDFSETLSIKIPSTLGNIFGPDFDETFGTGDTILQVDVYAALQQTDTIGYIPIELDATTTTGPGFTASTKTGFEIQNRNGLASYSTNLSTTISADGTTQKETTSTKATLGGKVGDVTAGGEVTVSNETTTTHTGATCSTSFRTNGDNYAGGDLSKGQVPTSTNRVAQNKVGDPSVLVDNFLPLAISNNLGDLFPSKIG